MRRIDFGARSYNASIGRFDRVDPLAEKRGWLTSYNFVKNNSLNRIDPNGTLDEPCCGDGADGIGNGMTLVENIYWSTRDALASSVVTVSTFVGSLFSDIKTQRLNVSYENGKRTLSTDIVPKGEVTKEVVTSSLVLASAIPSGGSNAGTGMLLTKTGTKTSTTSSLVRLGQKAESAEELAVKAAHAEANGFPHGVSTKKVDQVKGSDRNHKNALLTEVEKVFKVEQTGNKPYHHTVHLPKPVTQKVADLFNSIFKPLE